MHGESKSYPGNFTWWKPLHEQAISFARRPPTISGEDSFRITDISIGMVNKTNDASTDGGLPWSSGYWSKAVLPSGGYGRQWGDAHDTVYLMSLGASSWFGAMPCGAVAGDVGPAGHWVINLQSNGVSAHTPHRTRFDWFDVEDNPSSPPNLTGMQNRRIDEELDGAGGLNYAAYGHGAASWAQPPETIQAIMTHSTHATGADTRTPLGSPIHGNHAVADSCGLVGFEGVFVVSAFASVDDLVDPNGDGSAFSSDKHIYGGMNIQIHSGTPWRRGGGMWLDNKYRTTRTAAREEILAPIQDAMTTCGGITKDDGTVSDENYNQTAFFTGRMSVNSRTELATPVDGHADYIRGETGIPDLETFVAGTQITGRHYIVGQDLTSTGQPSSLKLRWLADMIPTRVRVVPSVVGYTTETVPVESNGGAGNTALNTVAPSDLTFRRPIVDYHVLISAVERSDVGNVEVNPATDITGTATGARNAESFSTGYVDMNLNGASCVIWHGVFRVNPINLTQVYHGTRDWPVEANAANHSSQVNGVDQVVVAKTNQEDGAGQGWGLEQITPMRPIQLNATRLKFSDVVEPAGNYQRGGISHHWDVDVFGGDLLLSSTITDTAASRVLSSASQRWAGSENETPPGNELVILRYSPSSDLWYPGSNFSATPHLRRLIANDSSFTNRGQFDATMNTATLSVPANLVGNHAWSMIDWVYPKVELKRYVGAENKARPMTEHPSLYCSSFRVMEDGRMMMLAIQRDIITQTDQQPDSSIGYPPNPQAYSGNCPPGYFWDGASCVALTPAESSVDTGQHFNPDTGENLPGESTPSPQFPIEDEYTAGSPFEYPTFSNIKVGTGARSLLLLWSELPASDGRVQSGRMSFNANADGEHLWNIPDSWWSGSRTSFLYPESGQRVIPLTYGTYPETRLSNAVLPRSMPHIDSSGNLVHGLPYSVVMPRINATLGQFADPLIDAYGLVDEPLTAQEPTDPSVALDPFTPGAGPPIEGYAGGEGEREGGGEEEPPPPEPEPEGPEGPGGEEIEPEGPEFPEGPEGGEIIEEPEEGGP